MVSRWICEPDPEQRSRYNFRNIDYGKFGPVDIIRFSATLRLDLSKCSQISFRSLRDSAGDDRKLTNHTAGSARRPASRPFRGERDVGSRREIRIDCSPVFIEKYRPHCDCRTLP